MMQVNLSLRYNNYEGHCEVQIAKSARGITNVSNWIQVESAEESLQKAR